MNERELLQKLVTEVVSQRMMLKALGWAVAGLQNPENPDKAYEELADLLARCYEKIRSLEVEGIAKEWGLPLSAEMQADLGPGTEFQEWFRRQLGE